MDNKDKGFTLIEVSLASVFVAFIIIILSAITISIIRSYNKGIWISQINNAGQQLIADINDKSRYGAIATVKSDQNRLCISGISYLWNTEQDILNKRLKNYFSGKGQDYKNAIRLVRIVDEGGIYCQSDNKMPEINDPNTRILLGKGAIIQRFTVKQGVGGQEKAPILSIKAVVSTEGLNRPFFTYMQDKELIVSEKQDDFNRDNGHWQCGQWVDKNRNNRVDRGEFSPAKNQFCSFAHYNVTIYERNHEK